MKEQEKRTPRSYKTTDKPYFKAMRRAEREDTSLAVVLENVVELYAYGVKSIHIDGKLIYGRGRPPKSKSQNTNHKK